MRLSYGYQFTRNAKFQNFESQDSLQLIVFIVLLGL